ncbi:retinol dehydrogenase 12-like [Amphiura filiformis]|uniref:retinol dehydrogenase 12-like n=1 Tax=Amphiura filiformis TaxID=82378 RepID=UPI003B219EBD
MKIVVTAISVGIVAVLMYTWGQFTASCWCDSKARLDGKTVIVTGSNTGIGKETARDLARRGAKVILACRNITKAAAAAEDIERSTSNGKIVVQKLDLSSLASVREFAKKINQEEERLDVLINNAGVVQSPRKETEDGFEMTFGTNHLGHFLLTNLLLNLLKKSASSRVINVSSDGYKFAWLFDYTGIRFDDIHLKKDFNIWFAYGQSKTANILFTLELGKRLEGTGVTSYSLHPGTINTEINRHAHTFYPLPTISVPVANFLFRLLGKTIVEGAQTTIYCAVEESIVTSSGSFFRDCALQEVWPHAQDQDVAKRLWEFSAESVGLET